MEKQATALPNGLVDAQVPLQVNTSAGVPDAYGQYRVPWQLYSEARFRQTEEAKGRPIIQFFPNPSEYNVSLPHRVTKTDVNAGKTFSFWRNPLTGNYFSAFDFKFTIQTGSLLPSNGNSQIMDGMPHGVSVHYELLAMLNEPRILDGLGAPNYAHLLMNTPLFPNLHLIGMFDNEDISWSESADDPHTQTCEIGICVFQTVPNIFDPEDLSAVYRPACDEAYHNITTDSGSHGLPAGSIPSVSQGTQSPAATRALLAKQRVAKGLMAQRLKQGSGN